MSGPYDEEKGLVLDGLSVPIPLNVIPRKIPLLSLVASLSYGFASLAMVFLSKAVLQQYSHSMTLLTLQQAATALLIYFGGKLGIIAVRNVDARTSLKLLPLSLFYNASVVLALASLKGVNLPMYIALKRLTPLTVLSAGFFFGKAKPSVQVSLSVMLIGLGVAIAAAGDFSLDPRVYAMALTSVLFRTAYLLLIERSGADDRLSSTELMLFNSLLSLPFLTFFIVRTGELSVSLPELMTKMASLSFALMVITALMMGVALNYTMFLCTVVNSALTTTIVGVLKGAGSAILRFMLLEGVEVHPLNVTGLVINSLGGMLYSFVKYHEKGKKKKLDTLPPTAKRIS